LNTAGEKTSAIALNPKTIEPVRSTKRSLETLAEYFILLLCKKCLPRTHTGTYRGVSFVMV
jgi:hypothetical protein